MCETYGNPSSLHRKGIDAELRVRRAGKQLAGALGCEPDNLIFTSGGTEANNLALFGGAQAMRRRGDNLVVGAFEHASVLAAAERLKDAGFEVRLIRPCADGSMDAEAFVGVVDDKTILASCMLVNSETGAISDVERIAAGIRRKNKTALIHTDAVQALGKIPFSAQRLGVDLLSVSAHKICAPKGCGALYVRKGVRILPQLAGGAQERGLRPGTENTPFICAFGHAAEKAAERLSENHAAIRDVYEYFVKTASGTPGICINPPRNSTPYIGNLSVPGYRSENLVHALAAKGIYVSSGSACSKGARSHVLISMGLSDDIIDSALRVSFHKGTTRSDVDAFFCALTDAMRELVRR